MGYLLAAYAVVLLSCAGYAWHLARRRRALLAELAPSVHQGGAHGLGS